MQALVKYQVAKVVSRKTLNKRSVHAIAVTRQCDDNDPQIYRMFRLMHQRLQASGIHFDPLNLFAENSEAGDQ